MLYRVSDESPTEIQATGSVKQLVKGMQRGATPRRNTRQRTLQLTLPLAVTLYRFAAAFLVFILPATNWTSTRLAGVGAHVASTDGEPRVADLPNVNFVEARRASHGDDVSVNIAEDNIEIVGAPLTEFRWRT